MIVARTATVTRTDQRPSDMDYLPAFVAAADACLVKAPKRAISLDKLSMVLDTWCADHGFDPVPPDVLRRLLKATGVRIVQGKVAVNVRLSVETYRRYLRPVLQAEQQDRYAEAA